MRVLDYQRLVVAYHGCDSRVRDRVITGGSAMSASRNDYDWLGHGIYFWEHGPARALEWAEARVERGRLDKPAVLGAILHLGQCFDLLDVRFTNILRRAFPGFCRTMERTGTLMPRNEPSSPADSDRLLRRRDCAVLNWTISEVESAWKIKFHSVRGVFQEGEPVFEGSDIRHRSHIQIAVRDPDCILGFFLPSSECGKRVQNAASRERH